MSGIIGNFAQKIVLAFSILIILACWLNNLLGIKDD